MVKRRQKPEKVRQYDAYFAAYFDAYLLGNFSKCLLNSCAMEG
jgi:hypothetical protein